MHVYISGIQVIRHVTPCLFPALRRKLTPLYSKIHGPFAKPGIAHGQGVTSQMNCNPRRNLVSRECSISLSFKTCLLFDFFFFSIHSVMVDCTGTLFQPVTVPTRIADVFDLYRVRRNYYPQGFCTFSLSLLTSDRKTRKKT